MSLVVLDPLDPCPLVQQIVIAVGRHLDAGTLRPGTRLPSIRQFARDHGVSRFTVVEAYDRLVAMGRIHSRRGSGFYAAAARTPALGASCHLDRAMDTLWLLHQALVGGEAASMPGVGWLPASWMDAAALQRALRQISRRGDSFLTGYGIPAGYMPLRQHVQTRLASLGLAAELDQILLTRGATHALDLIARSILVTGDTVLVDDPGYFILFGALKALGLRLVGVPWREDGPDVAALARLVAVHRPKAFFTNTVLHNPTGASISLEVAHQVLRIAEESDLLIVEDDVYGDFHPGHPPRLATLDQLRRVIYVGSFSKTISASARVGFIACRAELTRPLVDLKLLSGLTTSEIDERLVYQLLINGQYRKHMNRLHQRLEEARWTLTDRLKDLGLQLPMLPEGGMFLWADASHLGDVAVLAREGALAGVTLAPGYLFRPQHEPTPWLRFNVASTGPACLALIAGWAARAR